MEGSRKSSKKKKPDDCNKCNPFGIFEFKPLRHKACIEDHTLPRDTCTSSDYPPEGVDGPGIAKRNPIDIMPRPLDGGIEYPVVNSVLTTKLKGPTSLPQAHPELTLLRSKASEAKLENSAIRLACKRLKDIKNVPNEGELFKEAECGLSKHCNYVNREEVHDTQGQLLSTSSRLHGLENIDGSHPYRSDFADKESARPTFFNHISSSVSPSPSAMPYHKCSSLNLSHESIEFFPDCSLTPPPNSISSVEAILANKHQRSDVMPSQDQRSCPVLSTNNVSGEQVDLFEQGFF